MPPPGDRVSVLPLSLPPRGLSRVQSAVYVVGFDQYVKIGFSRNVEKRRQQLQEWLPRKLETYLILHGRTLDDERALHKRFSKYRLRGEWFLFAGELADWIEAEAGGLSERRRDRRGERQSLNLLHHIAHRNPNRWLEEHAPNPLDELLGLTPEERANG